MKLFFGFFNLTTIAGVPICRDQMRIPVCIYAAGFSLCLHECNDIFTKAVYCKKKILN